MTDRFANKITRMTDPANEHFVITPANSDLPRRPRSLWILTSGDVIIRDRAGVDITYPAVPAHTLMPFRGTQVRVGTTATLVGWD